jgi:hypothetical protein
MCTLDEADERTFLQAWQDNADFMKRQPGFHLDPASPRDRGEPDLSQLRDMGVDRRLPGRILATGFHCEARGLSILGHRFPATLPEGRGAGHLRRQIRNALA